MNSNIIIPKKIKVGFNPRQDTYTGMLGYVIYHDGKVWRKEKSWEGWRYQYMDSEEYERKRREQYEQSVTQRTNEYNKYAANPNPFDWMKEYVNMGLDNYIKKYVAESYEKFLPRLGKVSSDKAIIPIEYPNEPLDGFVLNRKAGGYSTGWNHRQTYCRVYDPRGFEFEISIPNLLYILENANSTVGKGLDGKFIYGWEGTELILIPENAPEYKEMVKFTELQEKKVNKKELIPGGIYVTSQNQKVVYLEDAYSYDSYGRRSESKVLWFLSKRTDYLGNPYNSIINQQISTIKEYTGENDEEYATYMELLYNNKSHSPSVVAEVSYVPITEKDILSYDKNNTYSWIYNSVFILENGKYKRRYLLKKYAHPYNIWAVSQARKPKVTAAALEYLSPFELLKKTPIYKQVISTEKTTK